MPRLGDVLAHAGVNLHRLGSLARLPRYLADRRRFKALGGRIDAVRPILFDYGKASGVASGHYFHQDLLVAGFVHAADPGRHLDVGSRIDGFVAHVASFRAIEVMDVRPLAMGAHPRIAFVQADLMAAMSRDIAGAFDSVSCLHALEHFGLGRYGDPVDPEGHRKGFDNLVRLVRPGGRLYLSLPVGAPRVEFNAQRVFAPAEPVSWGAAALALERFDYVDDRGDLVRDARPDEAAGLRYGCGIYTFRRNGDPAGPEKLAY